MLTVCFGPNYVVFLCESNLRKNDHMPHEVAQLGRTATSEGFLTIIEVDTEKQSYGIRLTWGWKIKSYSLTILIIQQPMPFMDLNPT